MKRIIKSVSTLFILPVLILTLTGCAADDKPSVQENIADHQTETLIQPDNDISQADQEEEIMKIKIGDNTFTIIPADTEAARALQEKLKEGPIVLNVHAYGGFEKTGPLPFELPADDRQVNAISGDLMLYLGDQISLFYGSNSWSYTPLGHVEENEWAEVLKNGPDEIELFSQQTNN